MNNYSFSDETFPLDDKLTLVFSIKKPSRTTDKVNFHKAGI